MKIGQLRFPSPDGLTSFSVNIGPISSQGSSERKNIVINAIRNITSQVDVLLTNDVKIEIAWYIDDYERYESDRSADADNIIKPIVDALSGPQGLFVNDCQVQSITSYWLDRMGLPEHISIEIKYPLDVLCFKKKSLLFIHFRNGQCLPINNSWPKEQKKALIDLFERQFEARDEFLAGGCNPFDARSIMPIQRIFHISRCHDFPVANVSDLLESTKIRSNKKRNLKQT